VSGVRSTLALALVIALVGSGAALAGRGDPQKRITSADQARAKSMVLRPGDLNAAFTSRPTTPGGGNESYCAALDESDLTVTGDATSPTFTATAEFVTSTAFVYESRADANSSWSRGTSTAGEQCLRTELRGELQGSAVRLVSFKRLSFPKRGQRSVAYRVIATQQGLRLYLDLVAIQVSRAQAAVIYVSALSPPPASELRRLSSLVERRAVKAMRGA
jgi:hypothetical protein